MIAGGVDASGPSRALEVLARGGVSIESIELGQPPARAVLALPGPRLLWIGTDGSASIVLLEPELSWVDLGMTLPPGVAASAASGEVLVHDDAGEALELLAPDLSRARIASSRRGDALAVTDDGTFLELDAAGGSRFRPTALSPFAPPPSSIQFPIDAPLVALDAPSRWRAGLIDGELGALIAEQDGASLSVPVLALRSFSVELRARGAGVLLLTAPPALGAMPVTVLAIEFRDDEASIGSCRVDRSEGEPLSVTREGDALTLRAGASATACEATLPERVGIALRAEASTAVSTIRIARSP